MYRDEAPEIGPRSGPASRLSGAFGAVAALVTGQNAVTIADAM